MKKFETPEIEISKFDVEDVITASGDDPIGGFVPGDDETNIG